MRAMTWWDHETQSVWSQPWGLAIDGPLKGTQLKMIPANIVPWGTWLNDHPETLVLKVEAGRFFRTREGFSEKYVVGIALGEYAKAYPYRSARKEGAINDWLGPFPLLILVDNETKAVHTYLREVGDRELAFTIRDGHVVDRNTESTWDMTKGIAVDGPLRGEVLQRVPYSTAFDWAWEDFYPHSEFYEMNS